ncbi:TPA_asm: fiber [Powellomyces chytrid fungus MELD virus 6]|nr:TPA_asm: fiber [Powellomyces chytrid fungus MELD virus 6]
MSGLNSRTSSGLRNLEDTNLISPVVSGNMKAFTANSKITGFQKVAADTIENKHGPLLVNDVTSLDPITVTKEGDGVVSLGLEIDDKYLSIDEGALNYKPDVYEFPLTHELESKTVELITAAPFAVTEEGLSLFHDASLEIKEDGDLSVVMETVQAPLARDANGIKLLHDESLKVQHGMLGLDYSDPLFIDSESKLTLDHDPTLQVNAEGQLSVVPETLREPIARGEDGSITFNYGRGLKLEDGELVSNTEDVLKPLGALHNGGIFDMGMDELTELGYDALADLTDEVPDTDITLLRLRTSDDFTQKNTLASFGGKALAIKSKGNNKIPFYGVFDGFNVSNRLEYNDTLSELSVPHVELSQNFNPNSNEAVTQSYVAQYIQSGSTIDVAPETNNRRLLNVRTDATLQVDANNNLGVNVSPLVNGSSVKIDGNGKISGGYIFQSANGVRLREGTNNDVVLALNVEGALEKVGLNTIKENMTFENGLKRTGNSVALDLQGSEHIQVQGNTVSTTLKPYTAGQNISISNNTISVNIPEETPYSGGQGFQLQARPFPTPHRFAPGQA